VEFDSSRREEFLKRPPPGKPAAVLKGRSWISDRFCVAHILEVNEADHRIFVPAKHGVDSLGELGAAGLVDADCVTRTEFS